MKAALCLPAIAVALALGGCDPRPVPGGLAAGETLVSLVATGGNESRPDTAEMTLGVETRGPTADAASASNATAMARVTAALAALGVAEKDLQTQTLALGRIDYGPGKGGFRAVNQLRVRLRDPDRAGQAVAAVTNAGANVVDGPRLTTADPDAARATAYAAAVRSARARADVYAKAAGLRVVRVVSIIDNGDGQGGDPHGAPFAPPPPPVAVSTQAAATEQGTAPFRTGTDSNRVAIRMTFALRE